MTRSGIYFLILLILNTLIAAGYVIWFLIYKKDTDNRRQYIMHGVVMFLCPVVGVLYFLLAYLKFRYLPWGERDLSDVEFSKKRHAARVKADENRERNIVSVGEAILVSDQEKKRVNMLNVLLGDTEESLAAISLALDSDDSEVAHYAASFLQSKMDKFRENVSKTLQQISESDVSKEECQGQILTLIRYMNHMLKQHVFTQVEQHDFVRQMEELGEKLFQNAPGRMPSDCYVWLIDRMTELEDHDAAERWGERFYEHHSDEIRSYTRRMKLFFETGQSEKFFEVLGQLRASSVIIDNQTLELIRMIQDRQ